MSRKLKSVNICQRKLYQKQFRNDSYNIIKIKKSQSQNQNQNLSGVYGGRGGRGRPNKVVW